MDSEKTLNLKSRDGKFVEISSKAALRSGLLKGMMEDYQDSTDFSINNVEEKTLLKVVDYLMKYKDEEPRIVEKPLKSNDLKEVLQNDWEFNFLDLNNDDIIALMQAANFMDIKPLLELVAVKIACSIKGTTTESIIKDFKIEKFNKEEEKNLNEMKEFLEKTL